MEILMSGLPTVNPQILKRVVKGGPDKFISESESICTIGYI